ncbi:DsbA family protein [Sphingomonas pokkalii]|uniref:Protein-disulfide isomerase n=1 Tax=Sphingomonas pokkalii TaxID=2175090 RepID=A0A2U0SB92_9SPHN|nr:thioredoxin domain-containing protein [Sphingomonas pokkalii]PVX28535.1 protein-disulfide isomerase [Sphingomonas pokkalii]
MMQRLFTLMLALVPLFALGAAPAPQPDWLTTVVATPEGGYRQGNPNAAVKLVEYGSRTCPTCYRFAEEGMQPLRDQYIATGKVSYEYRDFLVHGAPDLALALLNQCVGTQRFFPVLDAIYANQPQFEERLIALSKTPERVQAWQKLPPGQMATRFAEALGMIAFVKTHGLAEAKARQCLADPKAIARIAKTQADGVNRYKVDGTPSFFVNGRRTRAFSWPYLEPELRAAGA